MKSVVKLVLSIIVASSFLLLANQVYAFVGGGHGGFSGGSHGGWSVGHASSSSHYDSEPISFSKTIVKLCFIMSLVIFFRWLEVKLPKTKAGLYYRRKKYLRRCKHPKAKPKRFYSPNAVDYATSVLKKQALEDIKRLNYLSEVSHERLVENALSAFYKLQKAWSDRNISGISKACNNLSYKNTLFQQITKMKSLGVCNYIADTHIKECHLIKFYKSKETQVFVLRFAVKGSQIDEYTDVEHIKADGFDYREINCLIDVTCYNGPFKIYQIIINQHPDDYVMKELKQCSA